MTRSLRLTPTRRWAVARNLPSLREVFPTSCVKQCDSRCAWREAPRVASGNRSPRCASVYAQPGPAPGPARLRGHVDRPRTPTASRSPSTPTSSGGATAVGVVTAIRPVIAALIAPFAASARRRFRARAGDARIGSRTGGHRRRDDVLVVTRRAPALDRLRGRDAAPSMLGTVFRPAESSLHPDARPHARGADGRERLVEHVRQPRRRSSDRRSRRSCSRSAGRPPPSASSPSRLPGARTSCVCARPRGRRRDRSEHGRTRIDDGFAAGFARDRARAEAAAADRPLRRPVRRGRRARRARVAIALAVARPRQRPASACCRPPAASARCSAPRVSLSLVGRARGSPADFAIGLVLWGATARCCRRRPDAAIAAVIALGVVGVGNTIVDISAMTLLQRTAPPDVAARVFGCARERDRRVARARRADRPCADRARSACAERSSRWAPCCRCCRSLRWRSLDADRRWRARPGGAAGGAARGAVPRRSCRPRRSSSSRASGSSPARLPGRRSSTQGDHGDRFYVLARGRRSRSTCPARRRSRTRPAYVGEIALLRDVPRTATVRARTDACSLGARSRATSSTRSRRIGRSLASADAIRRRPTRRCHGVSGWTLRFRGDESDESGAAAGSLVDAGRFDRPVRRQHELRRGPHAVRLDRRARRRHGHPLAGRGAGSQSRFGSSTSFLTHLHLDHIEGLGFFAPLFDPECDDPRLGPAADRRLAARAARDVPLASVLPGRVRADPGSALVHRGGRGVVGGRTGCGSRRCPVRHPGSTVGYRLSENGFSLAYIPDNEPALDRRSGLSVADGADVLLHDAQFTDAEYPSRVGWGHSASPTSSRTSPRRQPRRARDVPPRPVSRRRAARGDAPRGRARSRAGRRRSSRSTGSISTSPPITPSFRMAACPHPSSC